MWSTATHTVASIATSRIRLAALVMALVIMGAVLPVSAALSGEISYGTLRQWAADADGAVDPEYEKGMEALDKGKWKQAVEVFSSLVAKQHSRADACLYWQAYAEEKLGRTAAALETIAALKKKHPKSRWLSDARALELEIRGPSAEEAADLANDELKIIALSSLIHTSPEKAAPILVKILEGDSSDQLKEQALFVLAQSDSAEAMEIVRRFAERESDPELQLHAVHMLGLDSSEQSLEILRRIYERATGNEVKMAVLHALMLAEDRERLLEVARGERDTELRMAAIQQLGLSDAGDEIWSMYKSESSVEVKAAILHAMFLADDADRLADIARTEQNEELRIAAIHNIGLMENVSLLQELWRGATSQPVREAILHALFLSEAVDELYSIVQSESDPQVRAVAIHNLGLIGGSRAHEVLHSLYTSESDRQVKEAILHGFFVEDDAKTLISIASSETDPELRNVAVHLLGLLDSDEAAEYLIKLLE